MPRYIVIDERTGLYKKKTRGFTASEWTSDLDKALLFKSTGAAKKGMYSFNINPERGKLGAKIILPDWVKIKEVQISL